MKTTTKYIAFGEIAKNYTDNEAGVIAYGGRLDVRPLFQREFVYSDRQREMVIESVLAGYPIGAMCWHKKDGAYAVIDGQQRIVSVCQYLNNEFAVNGRFFHDLTAEERKAIERYECTVSICEGTEDEILEWYRTINIAVMNHPASSGVM